MIIQDDSFRFDLDVEVMFVKSVLRQMTFLAVLSAALLLPTAALAAGVSESEIDVQLWPAADPARVVVIVGERLPETTKLPVVVRVPVLDGMNVTWAGEISADGQSDVERPYKIVDGAKGRYAELQLTNSRDAQIELGGSPLSFSKGISSTKITFTQSVPSSLTAFSVRIPPAATEVRISPTPAGKPATNSDGEALYTLPSKSLRPGDTAQLSLSYRPISSQQQEPAKDYPFLFLLVAGLVAAVLALVVVLLTRRKRVEEIEEDQELPQNAS